MKQLVQRHRKGLLQGIVVVFAIIATVVASVSWSSQSENRVKLGGTWVGQLGGVQWIAIHTPLDSDGKTAVAHLRWVTLPAEMNQLGAVFGIDQITEAYGNYEMINKDTAKYRLVWYGLASGTMSLTAPVADQVKTINVLSGYWHYTGPNAAESKENYSVYVNDGQPGHSMMPAPGAIPAFTQDYDWHPQQLLAAP